MSAPRLRDRFPRTAIICLGAVVAVVAVLLPACAAGTPTRYTAEFTGPSMGTTWTVKVVSGPDGLSGDDSRAIDRGIRDGLARINQLMSTWDATSELSRFNQSASLEPFAVAPETFDVFRWSVRLWEETGGALDPSLSPLIEAWGFGTDRSVPAPDDATIERLKADTGMSLVELDAEGEWVRKRRPGVRLDFSALAPGYAADRIAEQLTARGLTDYLVDVGGELVARGTNADGQPWQVAIERPQVEGRSAGRVVPVVDHAMATSGDYRNFREVNGARLTHILDPRNGRPVHHALASVTVLDALAVRADGLSTALMVMGPDAAMRFATDRRVPALFLIRRADGSFEERASPAFVGVAPGDAARVTDTP
jgi:thiamine biosynthesis lipoprotein